MKRDPSYTSPSDEREIGVDVSGITWATAVLVLVLILCCLVSAAYFFFLASWTKRQEGPILSPLPRSEKAFPRPQIQADPRRDYIDYYQSTEERLTQYRWINREKGIVAIPIHRAMEVLLERGLPHGREAAQGAEAPTWQAMLQSRANEGKGALP